jgi:pimeloyl-ACP methyl ester carboxylesterase/DNA-binding winged helix-turn-helix (wHTH) protein
VIVTFGDYELDQPRFELRHRGERVPIEPQAFSVLAYLVQHRERVVSKEELMDQVWGGRFVSESAVTSRVKQIRHAVGDDGKRQTVLRTVHSRGYQFVAAVGRADDAAPESTVVTQTPGAGPAGQGEIRYAISDGLAIAYQVTGAGVRDIVLVPGFVSHLELDWSDPRHAHFLHRLASIGRLIRFDKRGTGMSDRPHGLPDLETRMHDVLAVMDAAGSRRAVLFGYSEGGPLATLFAAAHPDRVESLILYGAYARRLRAPDYPWGYTPAQRRAYADRLASEWSFEADMKAMAPSADEAMARWWGQRARAAATPSTVRALIEMNSMVDVRHVLPTVRVPALVLHRRGDRDSQVDEGRYMAQRLPQARFVELQGVDHFVAVDPDQILDPVERFLREVADEPPDPRTALAAILAGLGSDVGDTSGRRFLTRDGTPVLLFDGPAAAVRVGLRSLRPHTTHGLGVHVAEVSTHDGVVDGGGATVACELAAAAPPDELWVTSVVRDLLAGSGITVGPCGRRSLGGKPAQQLYRVIPS